MKKVHVLVCLSLVACLAGNVFAAYVNYAEFAIAQSGSADYDASTGTVVWSGGASGKIGLTDGTFLSFEKPDAGVTIAGTATGGAGAGTSISFNNLTFSLTYSPYGQTDTSAIVISGLLAGSATYDETYFGIGSVITGQAFVDVTANVINHTDVYEWLEPANGSILETQIVGVQNFSNYGQNYSSDNLRIVVKSSNYVPEPATLTLLGLGVTALLKRRRRK